MSLKASAQKLRLPALTELTRLWDGFPAPLLLGRFWSDIPSHGPSFRHLHLWQESTVRHQPERMCPDQWLTTNAFGPNDKRLLYTQMSPCDVPGTGLCDFRPQIRKGTCQEKTQNVII